MANEFRVDVLQVPNNAGVMTTVASDADELNNLTTRKEVYNPTGGGFAAGDLVYISGYNTANTVPEIALATAADITTRATYVCVEVIATLDTGFIDSDITIAAIDTSAAGAVGDPVYLTATGTTTNTWAFAALTGASEVNQQVGVVTIDNAAGAIHFTVGDAGLQSLGADALMDGVLSANAAGRALVATGFFDPATALDKFAANSMDNAFMDSALAAAAFAADADSRAKFAAGIWTQGACATDLFASSSTTISGGNGAGNVGDLLSTAVTVIAAPAADYYIQPICFTLEFTYNTAAYDGAGAGNDIVFRYVGGQELGRCDNGNGGGVMFARAGAGTDVRHIQASAVAVLGTVGEFIPENATAVEIGVLGADPFGATGNGELKVNCFYRVLPYVL
jgi:hypothetical protein